MVARKIVHENIIWFEEGKKKCELSYVFWWMGILIPKLSQQQVAYVEQTAQSRNHVIENYLNEESGDNYQTLHELEELFVWN